MIKITPLLKTRAVLSTTLTAITLMLTTHASTTLTVTADLGGQSTAPLFAPLISEEKEPMPSLAVPVPPETALFPVISSRLHPGKTPTRSLSLPGMTPLFILGDDPLSLHWLAQRHAELKSLNATGLVVNVASQARLDIIRRQAHGLELVAVSGDDLALRLHLNTYPVLITATALSQ